MHVVSPQAYADDLPQESAESKVLALSRSSSSLQDDGLNSAESQARVEALRSKVVEAFGYARGNPANGKWGLLSRLLRLGVTRGQARWITAKTDGKIPESPIGWINARTEEEWFEWEKKIEQGRTDNVSRSDVQTLMSTEDSTSPGTGATAARQQRNVEQGSLKFPVVKRINKYTSLKSKRKSNPNINESKTPSERLIGPVDDTLSEISKKLAKNISALPESSFQPPSFASSQLDTSTPVVTSRHKPKPITPPSSLTELHSEITISNHEDPPAITKPPSSKRLRSRSPHSESVTKKPRILETPHPQTNTERIQNPNATVATPKWQAMPPTLNELLASAASIKQKQKQKKLPSLRKETDISMHNILLDQTVAVPAKPSKPHQTGGSGQNSVTDFLQLSQPAHIDMNHVNVNDDNYNNNDTDHNDDPFLDQYFQPDNLNYDGAASPAKSLSSLAESDSDSDPDLLEQLKFIRSEEFNPEFASTQAEENIGGSKYLGHKNGGNRTGSGPGFGNNNSNGYGIAWTGYSSQFDVDGQIESVNKLLDRDVDYEGWLRDPSLELEDAIVE